MSCWPPPSSKKRSAMTVVLEGDGAEDGPAGDDVLDELEGGGGADAAFGGEVGDGGGDFGVVAGEGRNTGILSFVQNDDLLGVAWGEIEVGGGDVRR